MTSIANVLVTLLEFLFLASSFLEVADELVSESSQRLKDGLSALRFDKDTTGTVRTAARFKPSARSCEKLAT